MQQQTVWRESLSPQDTLYYFLFLKGHRTLIFDFLTLNIYAI